MRTQNIARLLDIHKHTYLREGNVTAKTIYEFQPSLSLHFGTLYAQKWVGVDMTYVLGRRHVTVTYQILKVVLLRALDM